MRHWQLAVEQPDDITLGSQADKGRPGDYLPFLSLPFFYYQNTKVKLGRQNTSDRFDVSVEQRVVPGAAGDPLRRYHGLSLRH